MAIERRVFTIRQMVVKIRGLEIPRREMILSTLLLGLCFAVLGSIGCGQSAQSVASASVNPVNSYFGGPFNVSGSGLTKSSSAFDHATKQIGVSAFISTQTAQVPTLIMNGTYVRADTGFLNITENFATAGSNVIVAQNPPIPGAWAVEIPGVGALANFLSLHSAGSVVSVNAAPTAMAENTSCPNFSTQTEFLYVTVPKTNVTGDTADYGAVNISVQGSAVTFNAQPFLVGPVVQPASTVMGGCSETNLGALTAYPLNSFGSPSNLELISIGASSFLVSSFSNVNAGGAGAFGGGSGVIGVAKPTGPVDVSAAIGAKYNGFVYAPLNGVRQNYDITVLASSFGDHAATSLACSTLQSSLMANNGQGARTVPVLPSANSIYGGEFLTTTGSGTINDPSGTSGSENCDVAIDLGPQDPETNGFFQNATVFIGSNYPPYSASQPWNCPGTKSACAVSFPAAAVVGKVQGQFVIFVAASAASNPAAQLPDSFGNHQSQPVGIYLFQKAQ
jgi:hypothetical protein